MDSHKQEVKCTNPKCGSHFKKPYYRCLNCGAPTKISKKQDVNVSVLKVKRQEDGSLLLEG
jgi:hypothetical protein